MRALMSDFVYRLRGRRTRLIDRQLRAVQAWLEGLELVPRGELVAFVVTCLVWLAFGIGIGLLM